uniref:Uncharacterized protein n=1 Tax=Rhizophora mucronata TaxID=61149 RepID=A0A2P2MFG1_RHIMU
MEKDDKELGKIIQLKLPHYLNSFQIDPCELLSTLKIWKWNINTLFQPPPAFVFT